MTRVLVPLMILISLGAAVGASLPDDPELDAPVTLAVKGEALTDVLKMLQGQTGVRLQAGRDVADQKVTIFVDDKPLRKVMEGLSLLLEYHWTYKDFSSGRVYEIWEDEKTRLKREDWYTKALAKARERTDADLKYLSELSTLTSEQLAQLQDQLSAKAGQGTGPEAWNDWDTVRHFRDDPNMGTVAGIYSTFSPEVHQASRAEMSLYYDSLSDEKEWLLSEQIAKELIEQDKCIMVVNGETIPGDSVNLEIHTAANQQAVDVSANATVRRADHTTITPVSLCHIRLSDAYPLPGNHLPQEGMVPLGERKVSWEAEEIVEETKLPIEPGEARALANRSDLLALLHKKLGLQIIADHYSEWAYQQTAKVRPLNEILASFETMSNHWGSKLCEAYSGADAEFLYMRARDVRLCNLSEIPNRLLRPWQEAYARQGCLGLNELGEIALLSESQMPDNDSQLLKIGERPVISPVLKLYGLLNARQRKEAFSGGTKVSAFTPAQRDGLAAVMPTQKSNRPRQAVIVGIYKDGWRVDKEEPAPPSAGSTPTVVEMDDKTISEEYRYEVKSHGGKSINVISAENVQEAWEKVKADSPDAKKENLIWVNSRRIKATVKYADGTSTEKSVDIPSRIQYSKVKEKRPTDTGAK